MTICLSRHLFSYFLDVVVGFCLISTVRFDNCEKVDTVCIGYSFGEGDER